MERPNKFIHIDASVNDAFDGLLRLIVDAQRFGFSLIDLATVRSADASASIRMTIDAGPATDCTLVASRFSRHPVIKTLTAIELDGALEPAAGVVP